ncbi:hypothetical protein T02_10299 [Trichinella nativa]|uniref:Uncharacterized protein n=1 Tax=Trichinella nativa TaxID=6335 RepID=A0A0V1LH37_9BILA|nr:hypothetical protein T02_10299 [Trichinella nativa]
MDVFDHNLKAFLHDSTALSISLFVVIGTLLITSLVALILVVINNCILWTIQKFKPLYYIRIIIVYRVCQINPFCSAGFNCLSVKPQLHSTHRLKCGERKIIVISALIRTDATMSEMRKPKQSAIFIFSAAFGNVVRVDSSSILMLMFKFRDKSTNRNSIRINNFPYLILKLLRKVEPRMSVNLSKSAKCPTMDPVGLYFEQNKKNGSLKMQVKRLDGQLTNSTPHLPYLLQAVEIVFNSRGNIHCQSIGFTVNMLAAYGGIMNDWKMRQV